MLIDGTVNVTNPAKYEDSAVYMCNHGYHITPGVYHLVVNCTKHANWSSGPPTCKSKGYLFSMKYIEIQCS